MAWKEVTRDEFTSFLASYPMPVKRTGTTLVDIVTFEDVASEHDGKFWLASDDEGRESMTRSDAFGDLGSLG